MQEQKQVAKKILDSLYRVTTDNGGITWQIKDNPVYDIELLRSIFRDCHGERLAKNTTFNMIRVCLDAILENDSMPEASIASVESVPVYTSELLEWLNDDPSYRLTQVSDAMEQVSIYSVITGIAIAWQRDMEYIFSRLWHHVEKLAFNDRDIHALDVVYIKGE